MEYGKRLLEDYVAAITCLLKRDEIKSDSDRPTLGLRIKLLRKEKGMTQEALSERLGTIKQTISNWECNISSPDAKTICKLSELFGVTTDYLLKGIIPKVEEFQEPDESYMLFRRLVKSIIKENLDEVADELNKAIGDDHNGT